jgi:hypothetical protein
MAPRILDRDDVIRVVLVDLDDDRGASSICPSRWARSGTMPFFSFGIEELFGNEAFQRWIPSGSRRTIARAPLRKDVDPKPRLLRD